MPGISTVRRVVKVTFPLPNCCAASDRFCNCAALKTPFSVITRAEKRSVPLLSKKP